MIAQSSANKRRLRFEHLSSSLLVCVAEAKESFQTCLDEDRRYATADLLMLHLFETIVIVIWDVHFS